MNATTETPGRLLPLTVVAERLGVPLRTVQFWAAKGQIAGAIRVGRRWRVSERDLVAFVESLAERSS